MKKTNLFVTIIVLVCLLSTLLIACKPKEEIEDLNGYTFSLRGDEYAIERYDGTKEEIVLPTTYKDRPITAIGNSAFAQSMVKKITITDGIKIIHDYAFNMSTMLSHIYIPKTVTAIGDNVFSECMSLSNIDVDKENPKYSSLEGHLYNKDQTILYAYSMGPGTREFYLPDTVKKINSFVFYQCSYLETLYIPPALTDIGELAFVNSDISSFHVDENNTVFSSLDGILYSDKGTTLYAYPPTKEFDEDTFVVPSNIKKINDDAFTYSGIEKYEISDGVEEIGDRAFMHSNIKNIKISATVSHIGEAIFQECGYLLNIKVDARNQHYQDISGNLYNKNGSIFMQYAYGKEDLYFSLNPGVTTIAEFAFYRTAKLETIEFPYTVTHISYLALDSYSINTIIFNSNIPPSLEEDTIGMNRNDLVIFVPDNSGDTYKNFNDIWQTYQNIIKESSER